MLEITLKLECDACGRGANVTVGKATSLPSTSMILGSMGWQQFLDGPLLCAGCAQNTEAVERVARIYERHMERPAFVPNTPATPKLVEQSPEIKAQAPGEQVEIPTRLESDRTPSGKIRGSGRRNIPDEEIQASLTKHGGSVSQTARDIGCSDALIYQRITAGRVFQYRRPSVIPLNGGAATIST